jgi:uncharacterized protein YdeI (YjbR/CyaY-like superfamily)
MAAKPELPIIPFASPGAWEAWLTEHHASSDGLWLKISNNPEAAAFFETLNSTNRYTILYQIRDAKKPETRARRIEKYVTMLSEREKPYP